MRVAWPALVIIAAANASAVAGEVVPGPIAARVVRVVDGDTIVVRARVWLGHDLEVSVRLSGVDAPETRARCIDERRLADRARAFLGERIADGDVALSHIQHGKYAGRVIARVTTSAGEDLSQALLAAGLARHYTGGQRRSFCAEP